MEKLKNYDFYGNIRELENILERAAIFSDGDLITEDNIELRGDVLRPKKKTDSEASAYSEAISLKEIERIAIEKALRRWEGNRTKAANELGITRRTLITKIEEYDLDI
jgi:two-component system response regulator AtoC